MAYQIAAMEILRRGIDTGLVGMVASSVLTISYGICGTISIIYNHKNADINRIIDEQDILYKIRLIEIVMLNFTHGDKSIDVGAEDEFVIVNPISTYDKLSLDPVAFSIYSISETLQKIMMLLEEIDHKLICYRKSWFKWIMTLTLDDEVKELQKQTNILNGRYKDFLKIHQALGGGKK